MHQHWHRRALREQRPGCHAHTCGTRFSCGTLDLTSDQSCAGLQKPMLVLYNHLNKK
eukprot:CAMPEP_0179324462 /NCGR_PEP_ID=MMETSP0797-20121207/60304_1 /TAXON_ID=47934 /ORGANISM="Dinophysis acuminata, Strain DAEP01" /LENGTH=56 /DNA_ID=CAMNT_0021036447 /DNA_START=222 /DNA_END=389 /DNA_ORIENTATION=+